MAPNWGSLCQTLGSCRSDRCPGLGSMLNKVSAARSQHQFGGPNVMHIVNDFHAHIVGPLPIRSGLLRTIDPVRTPPASIGEPAREKDHQDVAQSMLCVIGMQIWSVLRKRAPMTTFSLGTLEWCKEWSMRLLFAAWHDRRGLGVPLESGTCEVVGARKNPARMTSSSGSHSRRQQLSNAW